MRRCLIFIVFLNFLNLSANEKYGILGQKAPQWSIKKWHNLPNDKTSLEIDDYKNKVLYLYFFQSWCPGCHSKGFPTLKKVQNKFKNNKEVEFVAIQTVFEGFNTNTFENALKVSKKFGLDIPIGQSGEDGNKSQVMKEYRTRGTPWTVIIGKDGKVKFNYFHLEVDKAVKIINMELNKDLQ